MSAAADAGWPANVVYVSSDAGLEGVPVAPHVMAAVSQLGSGTRAIGVYP